LMLDLLRHYFYSPLVQKLLATILTVLVI